MKLAVNYANLNSDITDVYSYFKNKINIPANNQFYSHLNALKTLTREIGDENLALDKV